MLHQINIGIHVLSGTIAMIIGLLSIIYNRRVFLHRKLGRYFIYLLSIVVVTGFIGFFFFRNNPFLLMLTLIASYVGFSGYRNIRLREKQSTIWDAVVAMTTLIISLTYMWQLSKGHLQWNVPVVTSTLVALLLVTTYDLTKYFFLHRFLKNGWLYEHIYKMFSAFSALLSGFTGNVFRGFHPYSQIGPSLICTMLIIYFIARRASPKEQLE